MLSLVATVSRVFIDVYCVYDWRLEIAMATKWRWFYTESGFNFGGFGFSSGRTEYQTLEENKRRARVERSFAR